MSSRLLPADLGVNVEADQGTEAHAVGVLEVGQVEDDSLAIRQKLGDAGRKHVGHSGDQTAVAVHNDGIVGASLNVDSEDGRGHGVGHRNPLVAAL